MNPLIECGVITEKQSGVNFMYVLNDNKGNAEQKHS